MRLSLEQQQVLNNAILRYGVESQLDIAIEEAAELIVELQKHKRGRPCDIASEVADVFIMLKQIEIMMDKHDAIQNRIDFKIERLQKRLEER